jgi:hypothetical protein
MEKRKSLELFSSLEHVLRQVLVIVEGNREEEAFAGLTTLCGYVEDLAGALGVASPISLESGAWDSGSVVTKVRLCHPYGGAGSSFRIDIGAIHLMGESRYLALMQTARRKAVSVIRIWLNLIPVWREAIGNESGRGEADTAAFLPTPLQKNILQKLNGRALKKEQLAHECECDPSRLYRSGGIKELRDYGLVAHKHGVGYFRPDAPPPGAVCPNQNDTKQSPTSP